MAATTRKVVSGWKVTPEMSWPARVTSTKPMSAVSAVPFRTTTIMPTVGASAIRNACGTMMWRSLLEARHADRRRRLPLRARHRLDRAAPDLDEEGAEALSVSAIAATTRRRQLDREQQA